MCIVQRCCSVTRAHTHKTVNPEVLGSRESGTNARAIFCVRRALRARPFPAFSDLPAGNHPFYTNKYRLIEYEWACESIICLRQNVPSRVLPPPRISHRFIVYNKYYQYTHIIISFNILRVYFIGNNIKYYISINSIIFQKTTFIKVNLYYNNIIELSNIIFIFYINFFTFATLYKVYYFYVIIIITTKKIVFSRK